MYIKRINERIIIDSINTEFVTAILGPRRVGKSTFINEYSSHHLELNWVTLNMDELRPRQQIIAGNLKQVIQEEAKFQIQNSKKIYVVIDEAQKCPELFDQIKILYDQYKGQNALKFILTGSGFLSLHKLAAETLAGRVEIFYLREFGIREGSLLHQDLSFPKLTAFDFIYPEFQPNKLQQHVEQIAPLRQVLLEEINNQLIWGGLPEILLSPDKVAKEKYIANYIQTYLEKDIRSISTIADLELYHHLMMILAEQTGSTRDDDKLKSSLSCSRDTLKKYRGYLLATLMYKEIYPFINSSLKRIIKSPKGYIFCNAIINYLTGIYDLNLLQKTGLIGHRLENLVLKELQIFLDREFKHNEIYFWRTPGGIEVDFVAAINPHVIPFEVTYSATVQNSKVKNLRYFLAAEPKARVGYYLYFGEYHYDDKSQICFLPIWAIC
jgi:uncharacterized protein